MADNNSKKRALDFGDVVQEEIHKECATQAAEKKTAEEPGEVNSSKKKRRMPEKVHRTPMEEEEYQEAVKYGVTYVQRQNTKPGLHFEKPGFVCKNGEVVKDDFKLLTLKGDQSIFMDPSARFEVEYKSSWGPQVLAHGSTLWWCVDELLDHHVEKPGYLGEPKPDCRGRHLIVPKYLWNKLCNRECCGRWDRRCHKASLGGAFKVLILR